MKTNKIYLSIFFGIGILAIAILYYFIHPESSSLFPKCVFLQITGYDCPGCGSQRAIHSILNLDIRAAFGHNQLLITAVPYLLICAYLEYLGGRKRFPRLREVLLGRRAILVVFAIVILFWILRNI